MLDELRIFARYAGGLREFFRNTVSLDQSRDRLAQSLARREQSLLDTLRRGVWQNPGSPYLPLFRNAGIDYADVEALVRREGVDRTLAQLLNSGVYVTLDEFKGKKPIIRPGLEHPVSAQDFDNPLLTVHFEGKTGGSGGTRRRLLVDLGLIDQDASAHAIFLDSFNLAGRPTAIWRAVPPNNSGIKKPLMDAKLGLHLNRWFSPLPTKWSPSEFKYAAFAAFTVAMARRNGCRFPYPEHVPPESVGLIVEWMAALVAAGTPVFFDSAASGAVRVSAYATAHNLNIGGSVFRTGGEPLTPARAAIIEQAGARVVAHYSTSETGPIGMACAEGQIHDDVHVLRGKMAVIHRSGMPDSDPRAKVLHLTTIASTCPKLMLNVDTGDSANIDFRPCTCGFGRLGYHQHVSQIRSHEKLTSEGILLSATDILTLVEVTLPAAFGGAPTDYQLVEDDLNGLPRVRILVSPSRGHIEESLIVSTVLGAIYAAGPGGKLMATQLQEAGTFGVLRREPFQTAAAKVMPLFVIREK